MKKQLLVLVALFSYCLSFAQFGTPFDFTICEGGDLFLADQTAVILNGQTGYTVTYHLTGTDAEMGTNPLPDPSLFTATQTVWVRITENANPSNYQLDTFTVTVSAIPTVSDQTFTACDMDGNNDGITIIDLGSAAEQIWMSSGLSPNNVTINFYMTLADAQMQVNPIAWGGGFTNMTNPQTLFYTATDNMTGCMGIAQLTIVVEACTGDCPAPTQLTAYNITNTSAVLGWTADGTATMWSIVVVPAGSPAPTVSDPNWMWSGANPFVVAGLSCGTSYDFYVRSMCGNFSSVVSGAGTFTTPCIPEPGFPVNLEACSDTTDACFDLTQNDTNVLGSLDPAEYTVTYYPTEADAANGVNPIATPASWCVNQPGLASIEMWSRLENNTTGDSIINAFALTVRQVTASNFTPMPMAQCDEDGNGIVVFDLTAVAAQLNTANPLSYYTNSLDATSVTGANAMANPQSYQVSATMGTQTQTIFIREFVAGGCDVIYSLQVLASSNCNSASACALANSLCGSLGVPFANTVNSPAADPGINYDCLFTQPNPTWFYLPISQTGQLDFMISQTGIGGNGIDVDFICWGPFASTANICNAAFLNASSQVACSYSTAAVENFTLQNVVPGQYYILMVTNFSNQAGTITISQTNAGAPNSGDIDCTGIRMNAFLDSNGNGTKDSGESNFMLGQFHYEKNDNGFVHNITSPNGMASIYDINPANSYDLSYTISDAYAANYAVAPSSYSNVSVVPGGGMIDYYFPVTVTSAYDDLAVTIIANQAPQPGFTYTQTVRYTNNGSQTVASGTITYTKPSAVSIVSVSESGATTSATGFTYNFSNLAPFESRDITVVLQVPTIPTVTLGQTLTATADIAPLAGDVAPENNSAVATQVIIGSWDPNDKAESRGEYVLFSDFTADDYLYYTIRFENMGTAPALDVRITDVLEDQLDESTVTMVAASHNYVLDRTDNVLNWTFDNIMLPHASANPEGAKGYVQFKVKPMPGYAIGDVIQNAASIYFDFNPAVITNTFQTHFVETLGIPGFDDNGFAMYPNPAGDYVNVSLNGSDTIAGIVIYDMLGKKVAVQKASAAMESVDVSALSSGLYLVEITTSAQIKTTKKLVIK